MTQTTSATVIKSIVKAINLKPEQERRLQYLIQTKGVGRKLSPEALMNWCLKITQVAIKIIKCLEYVCWANKRGQLKIKLYSSSGTLNDKRTVEKVIVNGNSVITKSYRVSLAIHEINEVTTYRDSEVISKSFCEHYFVSNLGRITNTTFPQNKYSVRDIANAVHKVSGIRLLVDYTSKDFFLEPCYHSRNNRIRNFFFDFD
jgi:hypothetical protein